jgi:hypothetical protein
MLKLMIHQLIIDISSVVNYIYGMNKLPAAKRAQILQMMAEGISIHAIVRLTGRARTPSRS